MNCGQCPEGRKINRNDHRCVVCIKYGMILKEEHECQRERRKEYVRDEDHGERGEGKTEIQKDSSGAAGAVPGILSRSGE